MEPLFGKILHVAMVVEDLYSAMNDYCHSLNIDEWKVYTLELPELYDTCIYGKSETFSMKVALAENNDGTAWELVQPLSGPTIYQEFLDSRGSGFHHLGMELCRSFDDTLQYYLEKGMKPVMEGNWGKIHFVYITPAPGTCIEFWQMPENYQLPAPQQIYKKI